MNLFQKRYIELHSGEVSDFKIECDALTDEDLECLAYLVSKKIKFRKVFGVPTGGLRFAKALEQFIPFKVTLDMPVLICDDVSTSGRSMEEMKKDIEGVVASKIKGVVIFARRETPGWIQPIFQMML